MDVTAGHAAAIYGEAEPKSAGAQVPRVPRTDIRCIYKLHSKSEPHRKKGFIS